MNLKTEIIFGPWYQTKMRSTRSMGMLTSKADRIAAASSLPQPPAPVRRRGVDKSQPGDAPLLPIPEEPPLSLQATQEIDCMDESESMDDEPLLDSDTDSEEAAEFDAECEERFNQRLDAWFAEYAPKLFELNQTKWNNKQAKKSAKTESSKSDSRSAPPTKKRKKA